MTDYKNINRLFFINLLSTIFGFVNTLLIGHYFGVGDEVSAYFAASVMFVSISKITQTGSVAEYFFNSYFRTKKDHGEQQARMQYAVMCNWLLILSVALIILSFIFGRSIVNITVPGFDEENQKRALTLFYILLFALPMQICSSLFTGFLNAEKIYGRAELAGVIGTLLSLFVLLIWGNSGDPLILVLNTMISTSIQFILIIYLLRKVKYKHRFKLSTPHFRYKNMLQGFSLTSIYTVAVTVLTIAMTSAISKLPQGTFALFKYIETIYSRLNTLVLRPLNVSYSTTINEYIVEQRQTIKQHITENLNLSFLAGMAVFVLSILSAPDLIAILWSEDRIPKIYLQQGTTLFIFYCFLLLVMGFNQVFRKLAIALNESKRIYFWWVNEHFAMAFLSIYLISNYSFSGILYAVAGHTLLFTLVPVLIVGLRHRSYFRMYDRVYVLKTLGASAVCFLLLSLLIKNLPENIFNGHWFRLILITTCTIFVFTVAGYLLKIKEFRLFAGKLRSL